LSNSTIQALFEKLLKYVTKDKPHLLPALAPPNTAQYLLTPEANTFQALAHSTSPSSFSSFTREWYIDFVKKRYLVYAQEVLKSGYISYITNSSLLPFNLAIYAFASVSTT
jgi:hypothetical protein